MVFYQIDTEEVSDRFVAPCFINGLEAYDGEINLGVDENMISNEYAVKLCLEHEVKRGNKVVKKELIVALRGEIYFVKFIINPEEDDVEPGVIFGRSFLRKTKAITDFGVGTITLYPDIDPFLEETEEEEKSNDDWDHLLDFNIDDVPLLGEEGLPPFVCKIGKSSRNKKRAMENLNFFYQDIGTSSSAGGHLTQEEAAKEVLAIRMRRKFSLLEEERPVIETMAYHEKYKKILDEVWKDKVKLDGKIVKEEEEAVKRIKGEALNEKDDPRAFIFPIRLEGQVNKNALADTRSDINTMPYRIYEQLGREDTKKVDRGITMINHTQAEAMGILINVLCQVGVTTLIAKFLILDILIDRDAPIVVGRGFLRMIGGIVNTPEKLFSTFDGFCHQTFRAARFDVMRNTESDSDDEEDYQIKRNKFGASIYGPKPAPYLNYNDPAERSLAIQIVTSPFWKISVWKKAVSFLGSLPVPLKNFNWKPDYKGSYTKEKEATRQWRTEISYSRSFPINQLLSISSFMNHSSLSSIYQSDTLSSSSIIHYHHHHNHQSFKYVMACFDLDQPASSVAEDDDVCVSNSVKCLGGAVFDNSADVAVAAQIILNVILMLFIMIIQAVREGCPKKVWLNTLALKKDDRQVRTSNFRIEYKHLFKVERKLSYVEQLFIIKAANANIGDVRAHNLYTGLKGSTSLVHGIEIEFKNFTRSNAELYELFWADEVAKCNYKEFGDIVSFDATYKTNKYNMVFVPFTPMDNHKKCVTVGSWILKNEIAKAYGWLLRAFRKAFVRAPNIVVTNQNEDPIQGSFDITGGFCVGVAFSRLKHLAAVAFVLLDGVNLVLVLFVVSVKVFLFL
ncbi:ribonuclease H-like domain-containing protein [Tanacetum coccineum]